VDHTRKGLVGLVMERALIAWALSVLAALALDPRAASGLAVGGGISLATLALYRALVKTCVHPARWRARRLAFAGIWLAKWPAIGLLLYWALKHWGVSPAWLCVGVSLVPAVVTAVAAWAAFTPGWDEKVTLEMR